MQFVQTFANKRSSEPAIAAVTLTHAGVFDGLTFGEWHASVSPAESTVSYPAALTVCGSNPHVDSTGSVFDGQRPFGLEFTNVAVCDRVALEWVDHHEVGFSEDQLWSHPEQVGEQGHKRGDNEIESNASAWVNNALHHEQSVEHKSQARPNQIALWAKNRIHASIIAGNAAVGTGK